MNSETIKTKIKKPVNSGTCSIKKKNFTSMRNMNTNYKDTKSNWKNGKKNIMFWTLTCVENQQENDHMTLTNKKKDIDQ